MSHIVLFISACRDHAIHKYLECLKLYCHYSILPFVRECQAFTPRCTFFNGSMIIVMRDDRMAGTHGNYQLSWFISQFSCGSLWSLASTLLYQEFPFLEMVSECVGFSIPHLLLVALAMIKLPSRV